MEALGWDVADNSWHSICDIKGMNVGPKQNSEIKFFEDCNCPTPAPPDQLRRGNVLCNKQSFVPPLFSSLAFEAAGEPNC